jgi:uncharacterized membrane protein
MIAMWGRLETCGRLRIGLPGHLTTASQPPQQCDPPTRPDSTKRCAILLLYPQMDLHITRRLLGWAGEQRALSHEAIEASLEVSGLRPGIAEWRDFAVRVMQAAGVLSLAAGAVFLVAYNWQSLGVYGRFATLELPLLLALALAWAKGVDRLSGRLALLLSVFLTGALLALFGQTYQTGADLYELFLVWALLAVPWTIACRWSPCWALWFLVLNVAASLYAEQAGIVFFGLLSPRLGLTPWALPFFLNVVAYGAVETLSRAKKWGFGDRWLGRGLMAAAMAFGTFITILRITRMFGFEDSPGVAALEVLLYIAASAGLFAYANWRREDLFPFAVLGLSWVVATTTLIGRLMVEHDAGFWALFIIALYVIGASSAAVKAITWIGRRWKVQEAAQ